MAIGCPNCTSQNYEPREEETDRFIRECKNCGEYYYIMKYDKSNKKEKLLWDAIEKLEQRIRQNEIDIKHLYTESKSKHTCWIAQWAQNTSLEQRIEKLESQNYQNRRK